MTKTILRVMLSGILLVLTAILVLAAKFLNGFFFSFYPAFSRGLLKVPAKITSIVPIAVWEILVILLVLWLITSLIRAILRARIVRWLAGLLLMVCIFVFAFVGIWGLNYFAPPMAERLGLPEEQYTVAQLREATVYYRDMANQTAAQVERDADGVMVAYDFDKLALSAGEGYETLAGTMDCFDGSTVRVKKLLSSGLQGKLGWTGIFMCLTGESSVSTTTFNASMPFTMCHEIGHRMAFARENEANFAAFLACSASTRPEFQYSGYYNAYIYCYNALYGVDADAAREISQGCSAELRADLNAAVAHYDEIESESASKVSGAVYDTYLKTFSVESGVKSYGEVTDLLLAWYYEKLV